MSPEHQPGPSEFTPAFVDHENETPQGDYDVTEPLPSSDPNFSPFHSIDTKTTVPVAASQKDAFNPDIVGECPAVYWQGTQDK